LKPWEVSNRSQNRPARSGRPAILPDAFAGAPCPARAGSGASGNPALPRRGRGTAAPSGKSDNPPPDAADERSPNKNKEKQRMGMMQEFREFALKGNVMDLAVGVIIGAPSARSSIRWSRT
jgi:hypothetical protein